MICLENISNKTMQTASFSTDSPKIIAFKSGSTFPMSLKTDKTVTGSVDVIKLPNNNAEIGSHA